MSESRSARTIKASARWAKRTLTWFFSSSDGEEVDRKLPPVRQRIRILSADKNLVDQTLLVAGILLAMFGIHLSTGHAGSPPGVAAAFMAGGFIALGTWSVRMAVGLLAGFFFLAGVEMAAEAWAQFSGTFPYWTLRL